MSDLILHQYADSPFAEKIRTLLGYKQLAYQSVDIPAIMPKPDLTALTGGYRRTPVMQRGADIYCDTALIAELIEDTQPSPGVLGGEQPALATAAARWTDSEFFRVCVGLVFQPKSIAANPRFQDPAAAEAFLKDRAAFTKGSAGLAMPLARAEAVFGEHLRSLEATLSTRAFLAGDAPGIIDFSSWHCCWFVHRQDVLRRYFDDLPMLETWLKRMQAFSDSVSATTISSADAIEIARSTDPQSLDAATVAAASDLAPGASVQVLPTDYGFQPVDGTLLALDSRRISIAREDDRAGPVHVHFPRYGFEVSAKGE